MNKHTLVTTIIYKSCLMQLTTLLSLWTASLQSSQELARVSQPGYVRAETLWLNNIIGINYCFAKLLLEKNCNVVIADLALRPEAQKLIDEYTSQPRAVFVKTNVVNWDELTNMFDVAEKEFGGADIVSGLLHAPLIRSPYLTTPGMPRRRCLRTALEQFLATSWKCKIER